MALNLFDVIRYEGEDTRNILAWRHPKTNIKIGATVIVNPGQCAVLFSNGRAVTTYDAGKHKIEGYDIQVVSGIKNFLSGGISSDSLFLWFVNMYDLQPIGWGTSSPIMVRDPESDIPVELKIHGNFIPRIVDLEAFILEFMPSHPDIITAPILQKRFRQTVSGLISSAISQVIYNHKIPILDIEMHSFDMSVALSAILSSHFSKYGISIEEFNIEALKVNQNSNGYREIFKFHKQILEAKSKQAGRDIEEYTYQEERQFDLLEEAAKNNDSAGNLMGAGVEIAMGLSLGAKFSNLVDQIEDRNSFDKDVNQHQADLKGETGLAKFCSQCGTAFLEGANFCSNCGHER